MICNLVLGACLYLVSCILASLILTLMELKATTRKIVGKKVKALRAEGLIPAELYGHGVENKHLSIPEREFEKIYKEAGEHTIVELITDENGEKTPILITHAERHPIKDNFLAVDLHQIRMDKEIQTHVPIEFTGESPAERAGFILLKIMSELEIKALPANIPHRIEVSIATLENPGDTIRLKDITIPEGAAPIVPAETVIASITEKAAEEEVVVETEEGEDEEGATAEGEEGTDEEKKEGDTTETSEATEEKKE